MDACCGNIKRTDLVEMVVPGVRLLWVGFYGEFIHGRGKQALKRQVGFL